MKKFQILGAYRFAKENGLAVEAATIKSMEIKKWKFTNTVRRGYLLELFDRNTLTEAFSNCAYQDLSPSEAKAEFAMIRDILNDYKSFIGDFNEIQSPMAESAATEDALEFAIEAHLRDFLAKHLSLLEVGLKLYEKDGRSGIEFPVTDGRIDILAVDSNNKPVVVELKLSRGRNRVLGQLLYYMGWIDEHLGLGPCRGIIVASEITDDLLVATQRVAGVSLAKYKMSFSVESVAKTHFRL